jgi:hypothetical protein
VGRTRTRRCGRTMPAPSALITSRAHCRLPPQVHVIIQVRLFLNKIRAQFTIWGPTPPTSFRTRVRVASWGVNRACSPGFGGDLSAREFVCAHLFLCSCHWCVSVSCLFGVLLVLALLLLLLHRMMIWGRARNWYLHA